MGGAAHKSFMHSSFHAEIKESLDQKTPDIVELHQGMTEPMSEIHILSNHDEDMIRYAALAAGARGFTPKVRLDELESVVSSYLP